MNPLVCSKNRRAIYSIAMIALFNLGTNLFYSQTAHAAQECVLPANAALLYGYWTVEFISADQTPNPQRARLQLEKNTEYPDSLSGWLYWQGQKIFVAGDWQDDELSLEESIDGTSISAVWDGKADVNGCGKIITGTRRLGEATNHFVMRFSAPAW